MVIETATLWATLTTALYLCSVALNSLMRGSYQESAEVYPGGVTRLCPSASWSVIDSGRLKPTADMNAAILAVEGLN